MSLELELLEQALRDELRAIKVRLYWVEWRLGMREKKGGDVQMKLNKITFDGFNDFNLVPICDCIGEGRWHKVYWLWFTFHFDDERLAP